MSYLYFIRYNPAGQAPEPKIINLTSEPAPTIMADGIAGDVRSHYFLHVSESVSLATVLSEVQPVLAGMKERSVRLARK